MNPIAGVFNVQPLVGMQIEQRNAFRRNNAVFTVLAADCGPICRRFPAARSSRQQPSR
jgi:hypothetical protein